MYKPDASGSILNPESDDLGELSDDIGVAEVEVRSGVVELVEVVLLADFGVGPCRIFQVYHVLGKPKEIHNHYYLVYSEVGQIVVPCELYTESVGF